MPVGGRGLVSIAFKKDASGCTAVSVSLPEGAECVRDFSRISGVPADIRTKRSELAARFPGQKGSRKFFSKAPICLTKDRKRSG